MFAVKLNGGRSVTGILRGFDPFMNLVVDESIEETKSGEKRSIGMVVSYVSNTILGERERKIVGREKNLEKFVIRELCKVDKAWEAKFVSCISSLQSISFSSAAEFLAQTLRKKAIFIFVTFWNFGHKISLKFKQLSTFSDCAMPLDHLVFLERKIFLVLSLTTQVDAWVTVCLLEQNFRCHYFYSIQNLCINITVIFSLIGNIWWYFFPQIWPLHLVW